jgi:hypothetical protein
LWFSLELDYEEERWREKMHMSSFYNTAGEWGLFMITMHCGLESFLWDCQCWPDVRPIVCSPSNGRDLWFSTNQCNH